MTNYSEVEPDKPISMNQEMALKIKKGTIAMPTIE